MLAEAWLSVNFTREVNNAFVDTSDTYANIFSDVTISKEEYVHLIVFGPGHLTHLSM